MGAVSAARSWESRKNWLINQDFDVYEDFDPYNINWKKLFEIEGNENLDVNIEGEDRSDW